MATVVPSEPRSLAAPQAVADRRELLDLPHIAPLRRYVETLRAQDRGTVPEFDPLDGGTEARALFLLEKPGPMTEHTRPKGRAGSGFVSRDNDDPTAEAIFRFMADAGIPRKATIIWNVVPWWNGTRKISGQELHDGTAELHRLIALLPRLSAIMLVGRKAGRARSLLGSTRIPLFASAHPSPIVRASRPDLWHGIPGSWAQLVPIVRPDWRGAGST